MLKILCFLLNKLVRLKASKVPLSFFVQAYNIYEGFYCGFGSQVIGLAVFFALLLKPVAVEDTEEVEQVLSGKNITYIYTLSISLSSSYMMFCYDVLQCLCTF